MKILVIGSLRHLPPDQMQSLRQSFIDTCGHLGQALARQGAVLVVGSDDAEDADSYVVEGAASIDAQQRVTVYRGEDWPKLPFKDRGEKLEDLRITYTRVEGPWERATLQILRAADAIVVIGGGISTTHTGLVAPAMRKPVVGLKAFGGAGETCFEQYEKDYASSGVGLDLIEALKGPLDSGDEADLAVEVVQHLRKNNPYGGGPRVFLRIGTLLLVMALIGGWGACLVKGGSEVAVLLMLGTSSFLGTALRWSLRVLKDSVLDLDEALREALAGLLLAFSLVVVYLAAGIVYEGDVLDISTENFKRTAVTTSALALAAAFLLERAAETVRQRLGDFL